MSEKKPCNCANKKKFSDSPLEQSKIKKSVSMIQGYAMAMASRGFKDKKVDKTVKQLRVLSCFGNEGQGGELPPCSHLKTSETDGKFFCGACGCGDRKATWLNGSDQEYSKLDYPKVNCPIGMPGFSNYTPSQPHEGNEPQSRKHYIENMNFMEVQKVEVTSPETPKEVADVIDALQTVEKNKETPK
jgi:hypothetical protein